MLRLILIPVLAAALLMLAPPADAAAEAPAGAGADAAAEATWRGRTAPDSTAAGHWSWPVAAPHPVVRPFVAPPTPYSAGHRGIDIGASGPEVFAPAAGVVAFAGTVVDRPVLSIRHVGGAISSFEPVETTLVVGEAVESGQRVGTLLPGHCARACLHFGVRLNGQYISPLAFLGGIARSILLPTRTDVTGRQPLIPISMIE